MHSPLKRLLILFIFHAILFSANAQDIRLEWVHLLPNSHGTRVVIDSNKSVIVTGGFKGTTDFDPGPGVFNMTSSSYDVFIVKYDSSGNFIWAKQLSGQFDDMVNDMEVDKNGDLLIFGGFQSPVDFDPGPGVHILTTTFVSSFLLRLDANGNFIWVKQSAGGLTKIDMDAAGNIILGGEFGGSYDFDPGPGTFIITGSTANNLDMVVVKWSNAGDFIWVRQIRNLGTSQNQQHGLENDPAGNIFFGGNINASMDFDPGPGTAILTSVGFDDAFLLKLTANGDFAWVRQFGSSNTDKIFGLEADKNGNVFSTGTFGNTVDFDPGPAVYTLTGTNRNCFISKLDANGNFVYAKDLQGGESWGQSLAIDSSNNLYISGGFYNNVDFDPGPGIYTPGNRGLFNTKLDENGNFIWAAAYLSVSNDFFETVYSSLIVDILKNVYYTGLFAGTVDFDPNATTHELTTPGIFDGFVLRLSQCRNSLNTINVETCGSYTLNGTTYTSPGTYYQTLTNSIGCDSIIQLHFTRTEIFDQISASACDEYIWNGNTLTNSGIYRDTLTAASGCDSIVQLNLTITKIVNDLSITACGSYIWNGNPLTGTGIYSQLFTAANGCDSLVNLSLIINANPQPFLGADTIMCKGETITLSAGSFDTYTWSNNATGSTLTITDTGTYWVQVTNASGCSARDSIRINASGQCDCTLDEFTKIYPAPVRDFLLIDKNPTDCEVKMDLYNTLGQLLAQNIAIQDGINNIPMIKFAAGMYFYRLHSEGKILLSGKILKQ